MAGHRYAIGDTVEIRRSAYQVDAGPYTVVRLLPNDSADREYRIKHIRGGQERVVAESGIVASPSSPSTPTAPLTHRIFMQIRAGYEIVYHATQPTPMLLMLTPHPSRARDLVAPWRISFTQPDPHPPIASHRYLDGFGNLCTRVLAPAGALTIATRFLIRDSGAPDALCPDAQQHPVEDLPDEVLVFLLGSRYCDTDEMSDIAWRLFGGGPTGWARVQAICDFVHSHIVFNYQHASSTRTASDAYHDRRGVCRDYAHLAVTLCRCLNIPARYCTGFLGDMGTSPPYGPMDFAAWFEVYLGGVWHIFDARNNTPRIGRILIARGRDATDVAIATTFGSCALSRFTVITDELSL